MHQKWRYFTIIKFPPLQQLITVLIEPTLKKKCNSYRKFPLSTIPASTAMLYFPFVKCGYVPKTALLKLEGVLNAIWSRDEKWLSISLCFSLCFCFPLNWCARGRQFSALSNGPPFCLSTEVWQLSPVGIQGHLFCIAILGQGR